MNTIINLEKSFYRDFSLLLIEKGQSIQYHLRKRIVELKITVNINPRIHLTTEISEEQQYVPFFKYKGDSGSFCTITFNVKNWNQ